MKSPELLAAGMVQAQAPVGHMEQPKGPGILEKVKALFRKDGRREVATNSQAIPNTPEALKTWRPANSSVNRKLEGAAVGVLAASAAAAVAAHSGEISQPSSPSAESERTGVVQTIKNIPSQVSGVVNEAEQRLSSIGQPPGEYMENNPRVEVELRDVGVPPKK